MRSNNMRRTQNPKRIHHRPTELNFTKRTRTHLKLRAAVRGKAVQKGHNKFWISKHSLYKIPTLSVSITMTRKCCLQLNLRIRPILKKLWLASNNTLANTTSHSLKVSTQVWIQFPIVGSSRKGQKIQIHMKNNRFHNRKASGPAALNQNAQSVNVN